MNDRTPQKNAPSPSISVQQVSPTAFEEAERDAHDRLKAIGLMVLALVLFSGLDTSAKYLATRSSLPIVQIAWVRFAGQGLLMLTLLSALPLSTLFATRKPKLELLRSVLMALTTVCNFLALEHLRLDQTVTVVFLAPLFVALLAGPFLGEWVGWRRLVAIIVGFLGILIVVRPGIATLHPAFVFAFGAMFAYALFMLMTRYLAAYDAPLAMLFYSILIGTIVLAPFAIWEWVWPASAFEWLLLLVLGVLGGIGHYLFIHANRLAPASIVAPFLYLQLISMVAFGYLVFNELPDVWTLVGSAVIIGSGIYLLHREHAIRAAARRSAAS
jgi:drug/metabolite transporter (DMT)-like permease